MPNTSTTNNQNSNNNNQNTNGDNNANSQNSTSGCTYDEYGRTPDKTQICGIGLKSASADSGDGFQKCVFENKCPWCGKPTLRWGWHWENDPEKVKIFEGTDGAIEGHFYCVRADGGCDADYSAQGNEHINGSDKKMTMVSGPTPSNEEEAKQLVSGQLPCDSSGGLNNTGDTNSGGVGGVKIPDVTFYGLIKQIMGATDSIFTTANNMAYLLSFQDMFEYRIENDEDIPTIEPSDVIYNTLKKNWTTAGYYNSVEVTYSEGTLKYGHDTLIKQYGENVFYYDCPEDDYETAKAKAQALLTAHVRDYSTDVELQVFYNPNITAGSWVKLKKSITQITGKTRKEKQQELMKEQGKKIETKRKGINITNITEETIKKDGISKKIHHLVDENGEKIDIEEEESEYDIFFVQSYNCKWDQYNSLIMNLHLKYGPDTPEDPINATIGFGGGENASNNALGGQYGNDTFTINDICVANNEKIVGSYSGGARVQEVKELVNGEYLPEPSDYQPRANKNSNYAKKYSQMKSPAEVYAAFRSEYKYSYYADNSSCWKNATDFYDNAGKTANCGDTACLLKVFFDCIGVPSCGVHIDGHYFNAIQINGTWEIIDGVRIDNQTCGFADGNGYCFGNPYPCDSYKSNGGDANE